MPQSEFQEGTSPTPSLAADNASASRVTVSTKPSNERKFVYLEQIRDFTYKDVVLADTKAGFALTISAASMAAYAAIADKFLNTTSSTIFAYVNFFGITGIICG